MTFTVTVRDWRNPDQVYIDGVLRAPNFDPWADDPETLYGAAWTLPAEWQNAEQLAPLEIELIDGQDIRIESFSRAYFEGLVSSCQQLEDDPVTMALHLSVSGLTPAASRSGGCRDARGASGAIIWD